MDNVVSFALKFRPKNLSDMVGQSHIRDILAAILRKHFNEDVSLPAGVLFTGSRGVGKTTSARILARVLNCTNRDDITSCGVCASCIQISKSNDTSVLEIDAASNGLVDDIRKLKDIAMTSHSGNYRVIVIDEVHGCSNAGFQALLKILEEPPANTLFIMATTEPHKVPETIISRLLVFEYKRLSIEDIVSRLNYIAGEEGIKLDEVAAVAIANHVDGGMRDAIMTLDQLHYISNEITVNLFKDFFGIVDKSFYVMMLDCLIKKDVAGGLVYLSDVFSRASSAVKIIDDFIGSLRDILLLKNAVAGVADEYKDVAERLTVKQVYDLLNVLWDIKVKARTTGSSNKVLLEIAYVKMSSVFGNNASIINSKQTVDKNTLKNIFG